MFEKIKEYKIIVYHRKEADRLRKSKLQMIPLEKDQNLHSYNEIIECFEREDSKDSRAYK